MVSGEARISTGTTSSNASDSPSSFTVMRMRAFPAAFAFTGKRTSIEDFGETGTIRRASPAISRNRGSRLCIVTIASPFRATWLVRTDPKSAVSPEARKRGNAAFKSRGLLTRTSACPQPNRESLSPATAMIRYVVNDSGSVTSAEAIPWASVTSDPSQNASTRKSRRTAPGPSSMPPPPPSSAPLATITRRLTMFCRESSFKTWIAFGT